MRSILVESDLGPGSDAVIRCAAAVALGSGAALHVLHALGLVGRPLREAVTALEGGVAERARSALQQQLARVLAGDAAAAVPVVDYRGPGPALHGQGGTLGADLLVVGPPRGADAAVGGALPVLVAREPFHWPPRSVLLAVEEPRTDGDRLRAARGWLRGALPAAHAGARRAELHVIRVRGACPEGPDAPPADPVLRRADRAGADLILLPHRPDDGAAPPADRTWRQVLHRAPCPVLLLPDSARPAAQPPDGAAAPVDEEELAVGT